MVQRTRCIQGDETNSVDQHGQEARQVIATLRNQEHRRGDRGNHSDRMRPAAEERLTGNSTRRQIQYLRT